MRSKEDAHDYRYFPEPDLVPLRISDAVAGARCARPCRNCRRASGARFVEEYGLREYDAEVLTATRAISEYFETAAARVGRSEGGGQLGDGRSDGAAQGRGQGDRRIAGERRAPGRTGGADRAAGETLRQAGQGDLPEDVRDRRGAAQSSWSAKG